MEGFCTAQCDMNMLETYLQTIILGSLQLLIYQIRILSLKKNPTTSDTVPNFINPCLYETQHVEGDTLPLSGA
jgi:hypothetical protein